MEQEIIFDENNYTLIKNYREGYDLEEVKRKFTEYFLPFDYIVGDWAYGKLRIKGFYKEDNKDCKELNSYKTVDNYIKNNCAYDCRHFILEKKH
ncbi:MAG: YutD family protein [Mollicutes bacterium]|nr:YutD family protein [Mollicutes bacterium]